MRHERARRTYRDLVEERGALSEFRVVQTEREGAVETIALNDPAVRAVVLTGAGRAKSMMSG